LDQRQEEEGSKETHQVGGRQQETSEWGGRRRLGHLTNPSVKLLWLLFRKEILAALGEELVDPHMEGHLLDPKFILGSDKNPCNGAAKWAFFTPCQFHP